MTPEGKSLEDLKEVTSGKKSAAKLDVAAVVSSEPNNDRPIYERVVDKYGRSYATGKRKDAVARVWIKPGRGEFIINGKPIKEYFARPTQQMIIEHTFKLAGRENHYDIVATVVGGGLSGQAGAVRHGVSKALLLQEPELRSLLKSEGLLTRDSRVVERKKYGQMKARRRFQFSKR